MQIALVNPQTTPRSYSIDYEQGGVFLDRRDILDCLSIRYLAAVAEAEGHRAELFDTVFEGWTLEEMISRLCRSRPEVVGISSWELYLKPALQVAEAVKQQVPECHVVLGGYGATFRAEEVLGSCHAVDTVVLGEGEQTFLELLQGLPEDRPLAEIRGLAFRDNGQPLINPARPLITDLDRLPFPTRAAQYPEGMANIYGSRGCAGCCTYCSIRALYTSAPGEAYRTRSPANVVEEMLHLAETYDIRYIDFVDDNFMGRERVQPGWVREMVELLAEQAPKNLKFGIQCRVDDVTDRELFVQLKRAGLTSVGLGVENDVQRVNRLLGKNVTKEDNRRAISILQSLRIQPFVYMILFEPFSTIDDVLENLGFLAEIGYERFHGHPPVSFSPRLAMYPGTPLYRHYQQQWQLEERPLYTCYEFRDQRVGRLTEALEIWKERVSFLAYVSLNRLDQLAARHGRYGISLRFTRALKRFLQLDMALVEQLTRHLQRAPEAGSEELQRLLDQAWAEVEPLDNDCREALTKLDKVVAEART